MLSIIFVSLCASSASAQSSGSYHYVRFYGGYTNDNAKVDTKTAKVSDENSDSFAFEGAETLDVIFLELVLRTTRLL